MKIYHKQDQFLERLFEGIDIQDEEQLKEKLEDYYTFGPFKPKVTVSNGWIEVDIDISSIDSQEERFNKVVNLCEKQKYQEAENIIDELINENPTNSEFYRIKGQIESDTGRPNQAIDTLIDALRWDSRNKWALIMMGNLYARQNDDLETAMNFYNKVLEVDPNDNIAINNIAANLMRMGDKNRAREMFSNAYNIDPNYPNTSYALGMLEEQDSNLLKSFQYYIQTLLLCQRNDELKKSAYQSAYQVSQKYLEENTQELIDIVNQYKNEIESQTAKDVFEESDSTLDYPAKLEIAEYHGRQYHLLKYREDTPLTLHLKMHELTHLKYVAEARNKDFNQLFTVNSQHRKKLKAKLGAYSKKLKKQGLDQDSIDSYFNNLVDGILNQLFNTPIDLFIEDFLYSSYPKLQPIQFASLDKIIRDGIKACTNKEIVQYTPKLILSKSKVLNLVLAFQVKELYGLDFIKDFNSAKSEYDLAVSLYNDYKNYRHDKRPSEEYDLIHNWAIDLDLDQYFELLDEEEIEEDKKSSMTSESSLSDIENDPFGEKHRAYKDEQTRKFIESEKAKGLNTAVIWYMVDALQYFKDKPESKIKDAAFEIAWIGTQGIDPNSTKEYVLNSIPEKKMSSLELLAYYYVSWLFHAPEMHSKLGLPYDQEYEAAKQIDEK